MQAVSTTTDIPSARTAFIRRDRSRLLRLGYVQLTDAAPFIVAETDTLLTESVCASEYSNAARRLRAQQNSSQ
ncbi:MAG: hypothetical protein WD490_08780 [Opitutales bacterium]